MCLSTRKEGEKKEKECQEVDSSHLRTVRREPCSEGWEAEGLDPFSNGSNNNQQSTQDQNEGRPDEETEVEKDHVAAVDLTTGDRADGQEDNHTGQGQGLNADNDKEEVNSDANNNVEQSIMQSIRYLSGEQGMVSAISANPAAAVWAAGQPKPLAGFGSIDDTMKNTGTGEVHGSGTTADTEQCDDDQFFEGVEKLLEVWFTTSKDTPVANSAPDLRNIPRKELEDLLDIVQCKIISSRSNGEIDAYLLSESSMFISKRRFLLKTCGTTTPLDCLDRLESLVHMYSGYNAVEDIFYSRKNFKRPDLQKNPYQHFQAEVDLLNQHYPGGQGYCMGKLDSWYMYTLNPTPRLGAEELMPESDQTIEILMSDLDPEIMQIFHEESSKDGPDCTKKSGIDLILPNMVLDDFLFEPCGYSMNGILKNDCDINGKGEYVTIHITPEPQFSYVSFESNIPAASYVDIVSRVLDTFRPGRFILTIFTTKSSIGGDCHKEIQGWNTFGDWNRMETEFRTFESGDVTFAHFAKFPS